MNPNHTSNKIPNRSTETFPAHKNHLFSKLPLIQHQVQGSQEQTDSVTPIPEHHSKQKRECHDCETSRICLLIPSHPAQSQPHLLSTEKRQEQDQPPPQSLRTSHKPVAGPQLCTPSNSNRSLNCSPISFHDFLECVRELVRFKISRRRLLRVENLEYCVHLRIAVVCCSLQSVLNLHSPDQPPTISTQKIAPSQ